MTNRESARQALRTANHDAGEAESEDYPGTVALIGVGYAILDVADAIRDAIAEFIREKRGRL